MKDVVMHFRSAGDALEAMPPDRLTELVGGPEQLDWLTDELGL